LQCKLLYSEIGALLTKVTHASFVWSSGFCGFTANSSLSQVADGIGVPLATLNSGAGYLFLLAGWSNLFWQPLALQYGKRPVYIISTIGNLVGNESGTGGHLTDAIIGSHCVDSKYSLHWPILGQ
jgi:hypothetical protein